MGERAEIATSPTVRIRRLADLVEAPRLAPAIEAIFLEASGRDWPPGPERDAFRERWLGRYLQRWPEHVFVALDGGQPIGYLAGCLDNPARSDAFADIGYVAEFAELCDRFPAHLHINLAPAWRGRGIGAVLIEAFAVHAAALGAAGVHVVTGRDARNVAFYRARGFAEAGRLDWNGRAIVFLGRRLAS